MKLKINENITFNEAGSEVIAEFKNGNTVPIPRNVMSLVESFDPPTELSNIDVTFGNAPHELYQMLDRLQDMDILIPDDKVIPTWSLPEDLLHDQDDTFKSIRRKVRGYTMGRPTMGYALYQAVKYICSAQIDGDILETGVWRGGNIALCAYTLLNQGDTTRSLYLFDTFDWSWPNLSSVDTTNDQPSVNLRQKTIDQRKNISQTQLDAELVSEDKVLEFLHRTGYPIEKFITEKGFVQDTIPDKAPEKIALLRLDTDLYESTYHELVHLYPRLVSGGILYIDDYPTEHGVVRAVEQYFNETDQQLFLSRIDVQGRIGIKP